MWKRFSPHIIFLFLFFSVGQIKNDKTLNKIIINEKLISEESNVKFYERDKLLNHLL